MMKASSQMVIRELPAEDRPRERMKQIGAGALSHAELLAIILRTGTYAESAVTLAQRLLKESGGLRSLAELRLEQLVKLKGIGEVKALQLLAGIELGRRLARTTQEDGVVIRSPRDIWQLLAEDLRYLQKEHFVCLFLNTKNRVIGQETLSIGSLNATLVHPREVFRSAIQRSAASLICAHNHPSGDPTPSPEDIALTRRLVEAGELVGIELLDHLIIGDQKFVSLKEQGMM